MGIFDRLSTLFRANINDLINRAETPEKMLNQLIGDKSVFETFERMTEQSEHEERKLIAAAEVNEDLSGDTLVKQFQSLEVRADADQQLIELKIGRASCR